MPDPCPVTVRAGPGHSRGYEDFVASNLREEVLQEITSNLDNDLKAEALVTFLDSVKDGLSIAACISKVQDTVLPKVPNERNKFFIKFVYDNKLQIEIGVNKFKNGNAQFYHKLGIQPRATPEQQEKKFEHNKRRATMQELKQEGGCPAVRLKKQVTNDRSAPLVSVEQWRTLRLPPNPTNKQTSRDRTGWNPEDTTDTSNERSTARPKGLGHVFRAHPPSAANLRSRSLGRPLLERQQAQSEDTRDRSASPMGPGGGKLRGLGDCFKTGIRPSQARLRKASPSPAGRKASTGTFELERNAESERLKNVRVNEETVERPRVTVTPSTERGLHAARDTTDTHNTAANNTGRTSAAGPSTARPNTARASTPNSQMKTIKIVIQAKTDKEKSSSASSSSTTSRSSSSSSLDEEWKRSCLEIEEIPESPLPVPVAASASPKSGSWSPSVEFLQPSTVFITEAPDGDVEEPVDPDQLYPIQNFRNRSQPSSQQAGPSYSQTFSPPQNKSGCQQPCQPVGPFFNQPFSPIQVQHWKEEMEGTPQSPDVTSPPPHLSQENSGTSTSRGWVNIPIQRL